MPSTNPETPKSGAAAWWRDFKIAAIFLTRLPLRHDGPIEGADLARAVRAKPLVGVVIGLIGGFAYALADGIGLSPLIAATLALAATMAATGCFHEDGLADVADGFGGAFEPARKLEIMRDSRIGTYGTAAVLVSVLLRIAALAALADWGLVLTALVVTHAVSRSVGGVVMRQLPQASEDGLGASVGTPESRSVITGLAIAAVIALLLGGIGPGLVMLLAAAAAAALMAALARRQIGGYTGDVLGAIQQSAEVAVLLAAAAVAS